MSGAPEMVSTMPIIGYFVWHPKFSCVQNSGLKMAVDFVRVRDVTHAGIGTPPRSRSSGQDGRSSFEVVRCLTFLWHFKSFHLKVRFF